MKNNLVKDSIILTIVKIVTLCTGLIQTMALSRIMSLTEYGVYSELLIIISIVTTFSNLGLNNAINYFYNKHEKSEEKNKYVNVIFALTIFAGIIGAIIIFVFRNQIANYYNNLMIIGLIGYILLRPLFANIISLYQSLYISAGKTRVIAIRNFLISLIQTISVPLVFYIFKNIIAMLIIQFSLDIIQIIYFGIDFYKVLKINPIKFDKKIVKEILKYAIPMGLALMMGTLFKEFDKIIIAKMMDIESLAIYTNMSKQLPFEFIATSFTTVVTPIIIKYYYNKDIKSVIKIWSNYVRFGYISTWILCSGAIVCSRELLILLYSKKYIVGLNVFIIYLMVDMFRFTYFGLILSATGETKYIMKSSLISLIANIILDIFLYKIFGMIGPAIASLICIAIMGIIQTKKSCNILNEKIVNVLDMKSMIKTIVQIVIIGIIIYNIKGVLYNYTNNNIIILIVTYGVFCTINIVLSKTQLIKSLKNMKGEKNG